MNPIIYSCGCGDTDQFAKDAFRILFPNQPLPPIVHRGGTLPGTGLRVSIGHAYAETDQPFAIYMGGDTTNPEFWDLLKGQRIR